MLLAVPAFADNRAGFRNRLRILARRAAPALMGTALALAPVTWMNYRASGEWIPISTHGGINFYLGNNENVWHTLAIRPGLEWDDLQKMPLRHGARTEAQVSAFFVRRALNYARRHPLAFARGLLTKTLHFLASRELPRTFDIYHHRRYSRLLAALVWKIGPLGFPFAIAAPLGLLGLLAGWRQSPCSRPLAAFLVLYAFSIILFFVCARYRVVLAPALLIFAFRGLFWLVEHRRHPKRLLAGTVLAAAAAGLTVLPVRHPLDRLNFEAEMYTLLGLHAAERRDFAAAESEYRRALQVEPAFARAHHALGSLFARQARWKDAIQSFSEAVAADPTFAEAESDWASALIILGREEEAVPHLRKAIELKPHLAAPHDLLGLILLRNGDAAAALSCFERAMAADPSRFEPPAQMAWILATHPDSNLRNGPRAAALAERALRLAGNKTAEAFEILAAAYAECGRYPEAVAAATEALRAGTRTQPPECLERIRCQIEQYRARIPLRDESLRTGGAKPSRKE